METTQTPSTKINPKDVFLHLLAIVTLYTSAGAFIALLFQYINLFFPDALDYANYYPSYRDSAYQVIRWSISALIIAFPIYLGTSWYINKEYKRTPEKRNFRLRKWLTYFTLFAAALLIIGDLVALVYNLLGGEFTVRFLLKVAVILFVSGSVFWYYLWDLRRHNVQE